jgi:hypothetical protein
MDKREEMKKEIKRAGGGIVFYLAAMSMLFIFSALFVPSVEVVRERAEETGRGMETLMPLLLLSFVWLFSFFKARRFALDCRYTAAYAWLLGSNALITVLLLYYLAGSY